MRRLALLIILYITCGAAVWGQSLSSYNFNAFNCPYDTLTTSFISMSGGTPGGGGPYDDCYYNSIPIGFSFTYCGNTYTSLSASSNCWIVLGQTFPFSSSLIVDTYDDDLSGTSTSGLAYPYNLPRPILAALWMDVVTTGPNVRYTTTGTSPNRVFTIEWSKCGFYSFSGVYPPHIGVEIKLYETTNNIDFTYNMISPGSSNTGLEAIGITSGAGAYPVTGTQPFWSLSDAGLAPTPSMTVETRSISSLPATGQVYRWSYQCSGKPEAGNISPSASSSCSSFSSTLSLECTATRGAGISYQWQSSPDSATWTNIPSATLDSYVAGITSSTYYRCVLTCANSSLKDTTNVAKLQLNAPPAGITGAAIVCVGSTTTLSDATTGGAWSSGSTAIANVATGVVTGVAGGTSVITYKLPTGCYATATVTVNPMPGAITGVKTVCAGATTTLSDALTGGTWSSSGTSTVTINPTTGTMTGISAGTATITYSKGVGAVCSVFTTVTINPLPAAINGTPVMCLGGSVTLSDATTGGTWTSSNSTLASINPTSGLVNGLLTGTATISYTLATGCATMVTATVNPLPFAISGTNHVCVGLTTTLTDAGTGTWASGNTAVATTAGGLVTGISPGTSTITFTLTSGCAITTTVMVNALPAGITGATTLCVGGGVTLSDATTPGTWTSGNTAIATIGSSSGSVTGVSGGTANITYTVTGGCRATTTVTINPPPPSITGTPLLCIGDATTLSDAATGGTWTSTNTTVASIDPVTGMETSIAPGTSTITYTLPVPGCVATMISTVNPPPAAITGPTTVCVGANIAITDATPGGAWSSGNTSVATITTSGIVIGNTNGTATITYTAPGSGCITTTTITVSSAPTTISGVAKVCVAATTNLSDAVTGGTWTSANTTIATAGYSSGLITGIAAGTATIIYSLGGACTVNKVVTVNPLPNTITGTASLCPSSSTSLSTSTGGGAWSSGNTGIAIINSTSGSLTGVSPGTATISYIITTTGCYTTRTETINALPANITGVLNVCTGASSILSDATAGGTWSSGNTVVAGIGSTTGIVAGMSGGTAIITYTAAITGCVTTATVNVTAPPPAITGITNVCPGAITILSDAMTGGSWASANTAIATIGSGTGVATGIASGTTTITYTPLSGCGTTVTFTVDPLPSSITGVTAVCVGGSITLSNTSAGTWTSGNTAIATIGGSSGLVSGIATGTAVITFTLPTGCIASRVVTVTPLPGAITGIARICPGNTTTLSDAISGGTWSSGATTVATIDPVTGVATGVTPGTAAIVYSLGTGCTTSKTVTVDAVYPITGSLNICAGVPETFSDAAGGGTWSSGNTAVATIDPVTGVANGIMTGSAAIINYVTPTGCVSSTTVMVNTAPSAITGATSMCVGQSVALSDTPAGGLWSSGSTTVVTAGALSGVISGIATGTATVTYTLGTGCKATMIVTVNPTPSVISGITTICGGATTTLSNSVGGGAWTSGNTTVASVGLTSGLATGVATGTATISYTLPAGCMATTTITIKQQPTPISGGGKLCSGNTLSLIETTPGGAWSGGVTSVATIGSTGTVTGIGAGVFTAVYSLSGCSASATVTVIASPTPISGPTVVCAGNTVNLSDGTPGGIWTCGNKLIAVIDPATGALTAFASGTVLISYSTGTGCMAITSIIVNPASIVTGNNSVCVGATTTLADTVLGGTWSSSNTAIAGVGRVSGIVSGNAVGIISIMYTTPGGCIATRAMTVNPVPSSIAGIAVTCVGQTTTLSDATAGGSWSSASTTIATVGSATGIVGGISAGTSLVSYTVAGCSTAVTFTVNPLPAAISGPSTVCTGSSVKLTSSPGGTWSSPSPRVSVSVLTGDVTGVSPGTATISYTLPTGCAVTKVLTVNASPAAIIGTATVCEGQTTALSSFPFGGVWSSANSATATAGALTGIIQGVHAGTVAISYTSALNGCGAWVTLTVNPLPAPISGNLGICLGSTVTLSDTGTGAWSSSATVVATINPATGIATGNSLDTTTITYTLLATGCGISATATVNPLPSAIIGQNLLCVGYSATLSDATTGGAWSSDNTTIATINFFGTMTGTSPGTATLSYTIPTGCAATMIVTVTPTPRPISGSANICMGATSSYANSIPGGTWSSANTATITIGLSSGIANGAATGSTNIIYTMAPGCDASLPVTVTGLPLAYSVTGGGTICSAGPGTHVGLSGSTVGVNYFLYIGTTIATGPIAGTGIALDFGALTIGGIYTVAAANGTTGCGNTMAGRAAIVVIPSVTPTVTILATPGDTVCAGLAATLNVSLTNTGTSPAYRWDVNGTKVGSTTSYSYVPADGDVVTFTLTSSALCASPAIVSGSVKLTVIDPVIPSATARTSPGDTICDGSKVTLTATPAYGGSAPTYVWYVNTVSVGTGPAFTYVPAEHDEIHCDMTSDFICLAKSTVSSNKVIIKIDTPVLPRVWVTANPGTDIGIGVRDTLTANTEHAGTSPTYQWYLNGMPVSGATTNKYISDQFSYTTQDSVSCMVVTSGACSFVTFGWIYIYCHDLTKMGVGGVTADGRLTISPNPNKGVFTIQGAMSGEVDMTITDLPGQVVYRKTATPVNGRLSEQVSLDHTLANGVYLLTVRDERSTAVYRVVIAR